jgi:glutamate racemase
MMTNSSSKELQHLPIGVFDSGVGGLTVLRALRRQLPQESFLYLGDTARLPYGTKSPKTVVHYAAQASDTLMQLGVKLLVVACNTASAYALPTIQQQFPGIPVVGVIEPGAAAAVAASKTGRIAVIATEATIQNKAYERAILGLNPTAIVTGTSCSLFVALAEEGWVKGEIANAIAREYLSPLFDGNLKPDCLVLGCTHFPVLIPAIESVLNPTIKIVDSASTTAETVQQVLLASGRQRQDTESSQITFLVTDNPQRFIRVAKNLLHVEIAPESVELIDL